MSEKVDFNLTNKPQWHTIIHEMTEQFVQYVLDLRKVDTRLIEQVSYELKITLGLFIATKLNNSYPQEMSLNVVEYFFEDIFSLGNNSKYLRRELIELVSDRHEYYINGFKNEGLQQENFFRSVGMHWFQFPLSKKDFSNVPFNYDFSKYFSDVTVVSSVLLDLAPTHANAILTEIELEYVSN